jgi:RHS repeat-associated protein
LTLTDANWGDKLTAYNNTTISYDSLGNPTNWGDALELTWNGRQLMNIYYEQWETSYNEDVLYFQYNSDGVRVLKDHYNNVNQTSEFTSYVLDGSRILQETREEFYYGTGETVSSEIIQYYYDAGGDVVGLRYNNADYYYEKNLQGDIIGIFDTDGNVVVNYAYDAWGRILSVGGTMAWTLGQINPFRYRSYYYDVETGLFYVGSRYYDPEIGRFINADVPEMMLLSDNIIGTNLFAYCYNNPVNYADPTGHAGFSITKAVNLLAPAMILTMFMAALNANYASGLVAVGGYITKIISLPVIKSFWWKPWLAGAIILGAVAIVTTTVIILYNAHVAKINKNNMNKKVKDILKTKLGSIKNAKLPPGSPSWNDIMELTLAEIYRRAQRGDTGFDTFKKLLTQGCYNK